MNLQDRLFEAIRDHKLLPAGTRLLLGVSGGVDSLALMHVLAQARQLMIFHMVYLHIATLDHGLRGAAGAEDARFVAQTAQAWGLAVTAGYTDVRALADERHVSIEAAARIARYDFLAQVAQQVGAGHVAVAHHADDQAETVLLHLFRGSGMNGLRGMGYSAPLPGHEDLMLIRPLLDVARADLEAYCREHGLEPRHDMTNEDTRLTRNRLRREILPVLRAFSPQIERHLLQFTEIATLENDFVDGALHEAIDALVERGERRLSLPRRAFGSLHPALQRRFILWAAQTLGAEDVGYIHVAAASELAVNGQVGGRAQLKDGIQVRLDYERVVVEHEAAPLPTDDVPLLEADSLFPVAIPGETDLGNGWQIAASLDAPAGAGLSVRLTIAKDSVVVLRTRREGDRFAPIGLNGHHQKISHWMIDHKVPRALRNRVPILEIDEVIVAILWNGWVLGERGAPESSKQYEQYLDLSLKSDSQMKRNW